MAIDFVTLTLLFPTSSARAFLLLRGRHGTAFNWSTSCSYPRCPCCRASCLADDRAHRWVCPRLGRFYCWNAPDWLKQACEPVLLFLDEVDRACVEVRQGIFELTDSRKLNGWHLHPQTRIFGCHGGDSGVSSYQVGEMDPAELDRWTVFDVEPPSAIGSTGRMVRLIAWFGTSSTRITRIWSTRPMPRI